MATLAFSANAAITDYATVEFCDGSLREIQNPTFIEVTEGAVLKVSDYEDWESIIPGYGYYFTATIKITNKTSAPLANHFVGQYSEHPSEAMAQADPQAWGKYQLCHYGAVESNSCLPGTEGTTTVKPDDFMTWEFDNTDVSATKGIPNRIFNCSLTIEGETINFKVVFAPDDTQDLALDKANEVVADLEQKLSDALETIATECPDVTSVFTGADIQDDITLLKESVKNAYSDLNIAEKYDEIMSQASQITAVTADLFEEPYETDVYLAQLVGKTFR